MANVLHRTTKQYLPSVNTPEYPIADWIISPNLSAVVGYGPQYWIITGDTITLMDAAARAAVDAAALSAGRDAMANRLTGVEALERAVLFVILDEFNLHKDKLNAILTAVGTSTNYASLKTNIGAIPDYPTRTASQLITSVRTKLGS